MAERIVCIAGLKLYVRNSTYSDFAAGISIFDDGADFSFTDATTFGAVPTTYTQANVVVQSAVPVPAAAWLFGSGLGLLGMARRRKV